MWKLYHLPKLNQQMERFIQNMSIFAQLNPSTTVLLGIEMVLMIIMTGTAISDLFPNVRFADEDDVKLAIGTSLLAALFITGFSIAIVFVPSLCLNDTGVAGVCIFSTIYTFMMWRIGLFWM